MKMVMWFGFAGLLITLAGGCGKSPENVKDKTYDIKGKVVAVDAQNKKVTLDHEDIPGLMRGMTMPFSVENAKLLEGIKPGDAVQGKLKAKSGEYTILELTKR